MGCCIICKGIRLKLMHYEKLTKICGAIATFKATGGASFDVKKSSTFLVFNVGDVLPF